MKFSREWGAALIWCLTLFVPLSSAIYGGEGDPPAAEDPVVQQLQERVGQLSRLFQDPTLWTDPVRKPELLTALATAAKLRDPGFVTILLPHIGFEPDPTAKRHHQMLLEKRLPVLNAIKAVGVQAIPELLRFARTSLRNPDNNELNQDAVWAVSCMREIYAKAGMGVEMARKRLELELAVTTDPKEQANLKAALEFPVFKAAAKP